MPNGKENAIKPYRLKNATPHNHMPASFHRRSAKDNRKFGNELNVTGDLVKFAGMLTGSFGLATGNPIAMAGGLALAGLGKAASYSSKVYKRDADIKDLASLESSVGRRQRDMDNTRSRAKPKRKASVKRAGPSSPTRNPKRGTGKVKAHARRTNGKTTRITSHTRNPRR